jgi:Coenzyme PQQ synthesis protein D (PqqD)
MANNAFFRVNTPTVSHETIDGEAVIINLDNGNYYSLIDAGSTIWSLVVRCVPVEKICNYICQAYEGERSEIERGVQGLLSQLQQENLIVSMSPVEFAQNGTFEDGNKPGIAGERSQFRCPELQKYTDMQELLLLDPVHEVDDMGWPSKPE